MKIVTDLDGVLRDINFDLVMRCNVPYPTIWDWSYNGKTMFDYIKEYPAILSDSPKTEYFDVIMDNLKSKLEIWTSQLPDWREYTEKWLRKNIGTDNYGYAYLKPTEKYDVLNVLDDIMLIEDYPKFKNYDKIILIDRPYNQNVDCKNRVKTPRELNELLKELL